jgi:hypothetical protein
MVEQELLRRGAATLGIKVALIALFSVYFSISEFSWHVLVLSLVLSYMNLFGIAMLVKGYTKNFFRGLVFVVPAAALLAWVMHLTVSVPFIQAALSFYVQALIVILVFHWYWQFRTYLVIVRSQKEDS